MKPIKLVAAARISRAAVFYFGGEVTIGSLALETT